ncbi:MAG: cysteine rich repeat-containing protein [Aquabacterium sp.]
MNTRSLLTVLSLTLGCALSAWAADAPNASNASNALHGQHGAMKAACKEDVAKLCEGIKPGGGRIAACLKAHKDQVSDGCKAAVKAGHAHRQGGKSATGAQAS